MPRPTEAELAFADLCGRHFARHYSAPPMVGRVTGWLLICEPPEQTAAEIAEALHASRSAIGSAVAMLESWKLVQRSRAAGERSDRIVVNATAATDSLETSAEFAEMAALGRQGLEVLGDAPLERRARLLEMVAFHEFLIERMPAVAAEWRERRAALVASGELPGGDSR